MKIKRNLCVLLGVAAIFIAYTAIHSSGQIRRDIMDLRKLVDNAIETLKTKKTYKEIENLRKETYEKAAEIVIREKGMVDITKKIEYLSPGKPVKSFIQWPIIQKEWERFEDTFYAFSETTKRKDLKIIGDAQENLEKLEKFALTTQTQQITKKEKKEIDLLYSQTKAKLNSVINEDQKKIAQNILENLESEYKKITKNIEIFTKKLLELSKKEWIDNLSKKMSEYFNHTLKIKLPTKINPLQDQYDEITKEAIEDSKKFNISQNTFNETIRIYDKRFTDIVAYKEIELVVIPNALRSDNLADAKAALIDANSLSNNISDVDIKNLAQEKIQKLITHIENLEKQAEKEVFEEEL